jgi:hypothetical protein
MKKILSLMFALLLALTPALAETAATQTLTSPDGSYTIEVPADYFPMNAATIIALCQNEVVMQYAAQSMGLENIDQMLEYIAMAEANNMIYAFGPDFVSNLNVQSLPSPLTVEMMVMFKDMLDDQFAQQYVSMGVPETALQYMDILQIGTRQWYGIGIELGGMSMLQLITAENGIQYVFTFADIDLETVVPILESFTIVVE